MKAGLDILEEFQVPTRRTLYPPTEPRRTWPRSPAKLPVADPRWSSVGLVAPLTCPACLPSHMMLPVVGVPIAGKRLSGEESLYSVVQMGVKFLAQCSVYRVLISNGDVPVARSGLTTRRTRLPWPFESWELLSRNTRITWENTNATGRKACLRSATSFRTSATLNS